LPDKLVVSRVAVGHPGAIYFFLIILMFGNFRRTAATTAACSGLPELLARASRACEASGIGYFLAPFSAKSDFGSFFLLAAFNLAIRASL
jgi:hypothetical protein